LTEQILKITKPSGYKLHASWFKGDNENKQIVIMCHGGLGDKFEHGRFPQMAKKLINFGFDALLFDFSGFGENERVPVQTSLMISDLEDVWKWATSQNYKKIGTLGLSLGGYVSLIATLPGRQFAVFWAPGFYLKSAIPLFQRVIAQIVPKKSKMIREMKHESAGPPLLFGVSFIRELLDINIEEYLHNFTTPTLIIQGTADQTVLPKYSKRAKDILPQDEKHILKMVEGAPHDFRDAYIDEFINQTLAFLKDNL
jgi:pimeloyl-ACP methyl ester carboxylesterase